jgi:hypothetical protein
LPKTLKAPVSFGQNPLRVAGLWAFFAFFPKAGLSFGRSAHTMLARPYVNTARVSSRLKIDRKSAARSIALLENLGILREVTGRNWGRLWEAPAILQIIHEPDQ